MLRRSLAHRSPEHRDCSASGDGVGEDYEESGNGAEEEGDEEPGEAAAVLGLGQAGVDQGQGAPAHDV